MFLVCLRIDESGPWPVLLEEGVELQCASGVEWRFVATAQTQEEGDHLLRLLELQLDNEGRRPREQAAWARGQHGSAESPTSGASR